MSGFSGAKRLASGKWGAFDNRRLIITTDDEGDAKAFARPAPTQRIVPIVDNACRGGKCHTIDQMCSRHSWEYQQRYGRAANE